MSRNENLEICSSQNQRLENIRNLPENYYKMETR